MTSVSEIPEVDAAAAVILAETDEWHRIMALDAEKLLDVYLDIKSPHAYLAVRPTLEVARNYRVRVNFLPYTLGYATVGVTTSVEPDMKRRPPTAGGRIARRGCITPRPGSTPTCRGSHSEVRIVFLTPHRRTRPFSSPSGKNWKYHF